METTKKLKLLYTTLKNNILFTTRHLTANPTTQRLNSTSQSQVGIYPILYFPSLFCSAEQKITTTAMGESGAERRDGTKRRRKHAPACSSRFSLCERKLSGGGLEFAAQWRLGVERSGNEVCFRVRFMQT